MAKLVWRVKLIAELEPGVISETEVARVERHDFAVSETLGLTLDEGKRLMATTQAEIVCAQVSTMGERFRWCEHCGARLLSKGYYPATFRSVFGDVGVRIRRLRACACRMGQPEPKSFGAVFATGGVAPELAYVTAKFAALAPFARVADLLAELLPASGAANAGTVRNRTMRVGATMAKLTPAGAPPLEPGAVTPAVIVGLDGGYVRSRHRRPERNGCGGNDALPIRTSVLVRWRLRPGSRFGAPNGVEFAADQRFDSRIGFRDGAENQPATSLRFDIADPHLQMPLSVRGVQREHLRQQVSCCPIGQEGGKMRLKPPQFRCRPAMRWPIDTGLVPATRATAKAGKPYRDLAEQRGDRMVLIVLHTARAATAGAG
jgi:hypothetical protein